MIGYGSYSLDVDLELVDDHHFPPCQRQSDKMKRSRLQKISIFENKSYCMSEISSWLLKPIAKKKSIQDEAFFLQEACFLSISVENETKILAWMKIKTMIFHMANSVIVLEFNNLLWSLWKRRKIWNR